MARQIEVIRLWTRTLVKNLVTATGRRGPFAAAQEFISGSFGGQKNDSGAVEALSEALGQRINKSYLFRVERGLTMPSLPRLRVLAQVYRVKPAGLHELIEALSMSRRMKRPYASRGRIGILRS